MLTIDSVARSPDPKGNVAGCERNPTVTSHVWALGTVVFGGMLASTLLAIPFVPVFFIVVRRLGERFGVGRVAATARPSEAPAPPR